MDIVKTFVERIAALRAAMVGSYLAAVLFIMESEMPDDNDAAINLWNDALSRAFVSKANIDAATKLIAEIAVLKSTGMFVSEEWQGVFADSEMLESEMKDAIAKAKAQKGRGILSDDNERSEKVWRDAVSFAAHWRIVPATQTPFKVTAKKKNNSLIAVAQSVEFSKDSTKELDILRAVSTAKGLLILSEADYKSASGK